MKKKILLFVCAILCAGAMSAQVDKPICFTNTGVKNAYVRLQVHLKDEEDLDGQFQASYDAVDWFDIEDFFLPDKSWYYITEKLIPLSPNGKVYFKNKSFEHNYPDKYVKFETSGDTAIAVSGNVMSMVKESALPTNAFFYLFQNCKQIVDASELVLPAKELTSQCYAMMFDGCTNLVSAPKVLPATNLKTQCYSYMFNGCTSLIESPIICAKNPNGDRSMEKMFEGCTSLKKITVMFENWNGEASAINTWGTGIPSGVKFVCPTGLDLGDENAIIPEGCTKVDAKFLSVSNCGWASVCYNKPVEIPTGVKAYYATLVDGNKVVLAECVGVIPASEGVMVKATQEVVSFEVSENWDNPISNYNMFNGATSDTDVYPYSVYVLNAGKSTPERPVLSWFTGYSIPANKAYLPAPESSEGKLEVVFADEPTGIKSIAPAMSETKAMYNLQGVRVNQNYNGIVIMNGKKYLVK